MYVDKIFFIKAVFQSLYYDPSSALCSCNIWTGAFYFISYKPGVFSAISLFFGEIFKVSVLWLLDFEFLLIGYSLLKESSYSSFLQDFV